MELTKEDIELLIQAVAEWEAIPARTALLVDVIGMAIATTQDAREEARDNLVREDGDAVGRRRRQRGRQLKAKLFQWLDDSTRSPTS